MSLLNNNFQIENGTVTHTISTGTTAQSSEASLNDFYMSLSKDGFFETGLLPLDGSGVLSIRQAMGHMQVVFQHAPGIQRVIWGASEGDSEAVHYDLAMPYRIVIGDFVDNEFYGARHFYSTSPITSKEQILYHVNLPNLNCKGYGSQHGGVGQGVGWICLYHNKPSIKDLEIGQKIAHLVERAGGTEAYNDANMNETDGTRFYEETYCSELGVEAGNYSFLWDPHAWETKTADEGFLWTLDSDLWIPIKVNGIDDQQRHNDNGEYLTVGMAMDGKYRAYYGDPNVPKYYQQFSRKDFPLPDNNAVQSTFTKAMKSTSPYQKESTPPKSNPIVPASLNTFICIECKAENSIEHSIQIDSGLICSVCRESNYAVCASCDTLHHYSGLVFHKDNFHCTSSCLNLYTCVYCSSLVEIKDIYSFGCVKCAVNAQKCHACSDMAEEYKTVTHNTIEEGNVKVEKTSILCSSCFENSVVCACGFLRDSDMTLYLDNKTVCSGCVAFDDVDQPYYLPYQSKINS